MANEKFEMAKIKISPDVCSYKESMTEQRDRDLLT